MRYKLRIHHLILVRTICKLIHGFGWTVLHKILSQSLHYLVSLQTHLRLSIINQTHQTVTEVRVSY